MTSNVGECIRIAIKGFEGAREDQYLNCCQSVISGLGSLTPINKGSLIKIGTGFGGGFAGMGKICGALTGGIIVIDAKFGVYGSEPYEIFKENKSRCKSLVREYYNWFKGENRYLNCAEITGFDSSTDEGMALYTKLKQARKVPCYNIIESTVEKLYKILTSE